MLCFALEQPLPALARALLAPTRLRRLLGAHARRRGGGRRRDGCDRRQDLGSRRPPADRRGGGRALQRSRGRRESRRKLCALVQRAAPRGSRAAAARSDGASLACAGARGRISRWSSSRRATPRTARTACLVDRGRGRTGRARPESSSLALSSSPGDSTGSPSTQIAVTAGAFRRVSVIVAPQPRAEPAGDELRVGAGPFDAELLDRADPRPSSASRRRHGSVRENAMSETATRSKSSARPA